MFDDEIFDLLGLKLSEAESRNIMVLKLDLKNIKYLTY